MFVNVHGCGIIMLTKDFLELFTTFVENYKNHEKNNTGYLIRNKEQNYNELVQTLTDLLDIAKAGANCFHDISIIDYLNPLVFLADETNPQLRLLWSAFIKDYNLRTQMYSSLNHIIKILPKGLATERLSSDLSANTNPTVDSLKLLNGVLLEQIEQLNRSVMALTEVNVDQALMVDDLTKQLDLLKPLTVLPPQIESLRDQLSGLLQVVDNMRSTTEHSAGKTSPSIDDITAIAAISPPTFLAPPPPPTVKMARTASTTSPKTVGPATSSQSANSGTTSPKNFLGDLEQTLRDRQAKSLRVGNTPKTPADEKKKPVDPTAQALIGRLEAVNRAMTGRPVPLKTTDNDDWDTTATPPS